MGHLADGQAGRGQLGGGVGQRLAHQGGRHVHRRRAEGHGEVEHAPARPAGCRPPGPGPGCRRHRVRSWYCVVRLHVPVGAADGGVEICRVGAHQGRYREGGHPDLVVPVGAGTGQGGDQQQGQHQGADAVAPGFGLRRGVGRGVGQVDDALVGDDPDAVHHRSRRGVHDVGLAGAGLGRGAQHHGGVAVGQDVVVVHHGAGQHEGLGPVELLGGVHQQAGEARRRRAGRPDRGRPAASSGARSGPSASGTVTGWSTRAMSVPMVVSAAKGTVPVTASIMHQGQGVDVAAPVEGLAPGLFGRRVAGGAQHGALRLGPRRLGQRPGQAEVGDAQAGLFVEEQVGRLDVAVHEAAAVGVVEAAGRLEPDHEGLRRAEQAAVVEHRAQAAATQVLGHQEGHVVVAPVEHRHDVGVVEGRRGLGLGPEAAQEGLVVGQRIVQDLDRHPAAQRHVVGQVDRCGRAGADGRQQAIALGQHLTDAVGHPGQSHGRQASSYAGSVIVEGHRPVQ